ncbi:CHAT domain-containing protein [Geminocystis herdmanii]|uniref:CHAT domain-containing protein n=1 Tax=Geminocystis herdmanii TaxID=669359 RepID=UPI000344D184|nr:CHAT domain-containing protein [Geminocystis herdmanii]
MLKKTGLFVVILSFLALLEPRSSQAQEIKVDGSTATIVTKDGDRITIDGNTFSRDGKNLFHSFKEFGLTQQQIATFLTNPNIHNILTRVTGGNPSYINGLIQVVGGNSNLFLMNPAGVVFGSGASINVPADFTATTATGIGFNNGVFSAVGSNDYSNLTGNPTNFVFNTNQPGSIINAGDLKVSEGSNINLIGGNVINTGSIETPNGKINIQAVAGTSRVKITPEGSLLSLELDIPQDEQGNLLGFTPQDLPTLLTGANNAGVATPNITIKNNAVGVNGINPQVNGINPQVNGINPQVNGINPQVNGINPQVNGINPNKPQVQVANTTIPEGTGSSIVSGKVSTSSESLGGEITVLGERVGVIDAEITANGAQGGGKVLIGGDFQGKGSIPNAQTTVVNKNSTITANATVNGDGGDVIVWADGNTSFTGNIEAKGGENSGDGGFVEVSGKDILDFNGNVDTTAKNGNTGTLLLDPENIIIKDGSSGGDTIIVIIEDESDAESQPSFNAFVNDDTFVANESILYEQSLENLSGTTNVIIEATNNITIEDLSDNALSFQDNITIGANPRTSVTFRADSDGIGGGDFSMSATDTIIARGRDVNISGNNITVGAIDTSTPIDTNGNAGDITLNATNNISVQGTSTGEGAFPYSLGAFVSVGGVGNAGNIRLDSTNASISISPDNGNIIATTPSGNAGNIILNAPNGNVNLPSNIRFESFSNSNNTGNVILTGNNIQPSGANSTVDFVVNNEVVVNTENFNVVMNNTGIGNPVININSDNNLTLNQNISTNGGDFNAGANDSIVVNDNVAINSNDGNVTLNSDRDGLNGGAIRMNSGSSITANGGNIVLGGGGDNPLSTPAIGVANTGANPNDRNYGILLNNATLETNGTGLISLRGTGFGGTGNDNAGIGLQGNTTIRTVEGNITLVGTGQASGQRNHGIGFSSPDIANETIIIESTGTGNINLVGIHEGNGTGSNVGILTEGDTSANPTRIISNSGIITLNGLTNASSDTSRGISIQANSQINSIGGGSINLNAHSINNDDAIRVFENGAIITSGTTTFNTLSIDNGNGETIIYPLGSEKDIFIPLTSPSDFGEVRINNARNVILNDVNDLILSNLTVNGDLNITVGNTLTQTSDSLITVLGNTSLTTTAQNLGNVDISNNTATELGEVLVGGNFNLNSNGEVTQTASGKVQVAGTTTVQPSGTSLNNPDNIINKSGAVNVEEDNQNITVTGTGIIDVSKALLDNEQSTDIIGNLTVISETGEGGVGFNGQPLSGNVISLNNTGNNFNGTVNIATQAPPIQQVESTPAGIVQTDALTVGGLTSLNATNEGNITLISNNDFNILSVVAGNSININDVNSLVLSNVTANADLNITVGNTLTQTPDSLITVLGNTSLTTTAQNLGDVDISNNGTTELGEVLVGGNFNLNSSGEVTQTPSGKIQVAGTTTIEPSGANLNNPDNIINGTNSNGSVEIDANQNVTITKQGEIDISESLSNQGLSNNITGNLTVTSEVGEGGIAFDGQALTGNVISLNNTGNNFNGTVNITTQAPPIVPTESSPPGIVQTDAITVTGRTRLNATNQGNITLTHSNNDFNILSVVEGNNVSIVDRNSLNLANINASNLTITTNGNITNSGSIFVANNTILDTGGNDIILGNSSNDFNIVSVNNANNVTLSDINNLTLSNVDSSDNPIDINISGDLALRVTQINTINSNIQANSLTTNPAGTTILRGNVTTTGNQTYRDAVTLASDVQLDGNNITFGSSIDGSQNLIINTNQEGRTTLNGSVGSVTPLSSLTTNADGKTILNGNVSTTGNQNYNNNVLLQQSTVFQGNNLTAVSIEANQNSTTPISLTINASDSVTITGKPGANSLLAISTARTNNQETGNITINANNDINLQGAVNTTATSATFFATKAGDISLATENGDVSVLAIASMGTETSGNVTISGNNIDTGTILTFLNPTNVTTGNINIQGNTTTVSGTIQGLSLTTLGTFTLAENPAILALPNRALASLGNAKVTTINDQNYQNFNIANNANLNSTQGNINFTGSVNGNGNNLTMSSLKGVNFGNQNFTSLGGNLVITSFNSGEILIGSGNDSQFVISNLDRANGFDSITIGQNNTSGTITINENLTVNDPLTLQASNIVVNNNINGNDNASITLKGSKTTTTLNADIITQGNNITIDDNVLVGSNVTLSTGNNSTGNIDILGSINGNNNLTLNAGSNSISLTDNISLGNFSVTSNNTVFQGDSITTTGNQNFNSNLTLTKNTNFNSQGTFSSQNISSNGTNVILNAESISTQNIMTQGGNISMISSEGAVSTQNLDTSGTTGGSIELNSNTTINTGTIQTSGSSQGGNVTLNAPSDIVVTSIDARGNNGGDVEITTAGTLRVTGTVGDGVSINTTGDSSDGSVTIDLFPDDSENGVISDPRLPFVIGDASKNGTAGTINNFNFSLDAGEYVINTTNGNLNLRLLSRVPVDPNNSVNVNNPVTTAVATFAPPVIPIATITEAQEILSAIEREAAEKPAFIYVSFTPKGFQPKDLEAEFARREATNTQEYSRVNINNPNLQPTIALQPAEDDQLDLLVITNEGEPIRVTVPVTRKEVVDSALNLSIELSSDRLDEQYKPYATELYSWLITPIEETLKEREISNLLFILPLNIRFAPLASLYDEKTEQFLVEKYSSGLAPSLNLNDNTYRSVKDLNLLAMGAAEFAEDQQQTPLPGVSIELPTIKKIWNQQASDNYREFLNDNFTLETIQANLDKQPYGIIHFGTHGSFGADEQEDIFIQLYNSRLNFDDINQLGLSRSKVELMLLSACQTALGNDIAELGFAGLAVQAGVKSAIGTVWTIGDTGTLAFMTDFYSELRTQTTKAEALRQTQLNMLNGKIYKSEDGNTIITPNMSVSLEGLPEDSRLREDFSHPFYWAPFTLIGNPW